MVQNPKGGGLSSSFGGGGTQQLGGVKKTGDFLDKSTWTLATLLLVLILASNFAVPGLGENAESKVLRDDQTTTTPAAATTPDTQNTQETKTEENQ